MADAASGLSGSRRASRTALAAAQAEAELAFGDPDCLPRAVRPQGPARRGADHRRRSGRHLGRRRARLHGAAAQPEGDRGVRVHRAGRTAGEQRDPCRRGAHRRRGGLPQCGHRRVPRRPRDRPLPVHGGEHPAAGRAPGHGGDLGARPGQAAAAHRARAAGSTGRPPAVARSRHRGAVVRRGPRAGLRPGTRAASRCWRPPAGAGHPRRHRA